MRAHLLRAALSPRPRARSAAQQPPRGQPASQTLVLRSRTRARACVFPICRRWFFFSVYNNHRILWRSRSEQPARTALVGARQWLREVARDNEDQFVRVPYIYTLLAKVNKRFTHTHVNTVIFLYRQLRFPFFFSHNCACTLAELLSLSASAGYRHSLAS